MADVVSEIKNYAKENKLVLGAQEALKGLRVGKFAKIYVAVNCEKRLEDDIRHYASLAGVDVVETGLTNVDLGDTCKKPFSISVIGLLK